MSLVNNAEKFFENHPLNKEIMKFTARERSSAVAAAERDAAAELGLKNLPEDAEENIVNAVCEQAIFLLLHPEYLSGDKSFENSNLSPRAAVLLGSKTAVTVPLPLVRG